MANDNNLTNIQIAELLRDVAAAYQLKDDKKFRFQIIAYERAADAVEHASSELKDLWDESKLNEVPGVGKSIALHLDEIFRNGRSEHFDEIMKGLPKQMFPLMQVSGIGAKTAFKLVNFFKNQISVSDPIGSLQKLASEGKISQLEGFGKDSEKDILASIKEIRGREKRLLLPYATEIADEIINWLKKDVSVSKADPLGSLRRRASTIGDIDIAVASDKAERVLSHFVKYPKVQRVIEKGTRTASIIVPGNIRVDAMVETPSAYGALLQHFTGSKHHNIALRELALKRNLSLSDYGIYVKKGSKKILNKIRSEEAFYGFLHMPFIPPEIREDTGEIEAAINNKLPHLIELKDVKADLQMHTDFDIETSHDLGLSSMVHHLKKADMLGYQYIAFTEHNPSQKGHNGKQVVDLLKRKKEVVDKLNYSINKYVKKNMKKIFNSLEIDILPDGRLPVPEEAFNYLDFALVSIHSSFRLDKKRMTKRVLSALNFHPKVKIFAHPTGRLLQEREGVELNWQEIFEICFKENKWLEVNCDPLRLDLPDFLVREAVKQGVKLTLGTDAHHIDLMDNMKFGVSVARRGWVEKKDCVNTLDLADFEKMLK